MQDQGIRGARNKGGQKHGCPQSGEAPGLGGLAPHPAPSPRTRPDPASLSKNYTQGRLLCVSYTKEPVNVTLHAPHDQISPCLCRPLSGSLHPPAAPRPGLVYWGAMRNRRPQADFRRHLGAEHQDRLCYQIRPLRPLQLVHKTAGVSPALPGARISLGPSLSAPPGTPLRSGISHCRVIHHRPSAPTGQLSGMLRSHSCLLSDSGASLLDCFPPLSAAMSPWNPLHPCEGGWGVGAHRPRLQLPLDLGLGFSLCSLGRFYSN